MCMQYPIFHDAQHVSHTHTLTHTFLSSFYTIAINRSHGPYEGRNTGHVFITSFSLSYVQDGELLP